MRRKQIGLYIHIPFCKQKCSYCDFCSYAEKQDLIVGKYYYREISAPDKYIVDNKEKSFKLSDNGEIFEATVYNEAKTLPVTGGSLSLDMLIVLMVAGFSIVGFTTMKVVKEKKEHNL